MRLRNILRRRAIDREMLEEMKAHLERATERLVARGLSPGEARLAARREFGNVAALQEEGRDARGARWIESVASDMRFALRYFMRKPLSTATIILVLSIGIGVHAAAFSLIQSMTMRPPPGVPDDDALVAVRGMRKTERDTRWRPRALSYPELHDLAQEREIFSSVAAWSSQTVSLETIQDDQRWGQVQFVTSDFFSTLGIRPLLGTGLPFDDPVASGSQLVAVIGHALWSTEFGASPEVIGRTIRVNDVAVRIVGVAPPRFRGVIARGTNTLWMPLSARASIVRTNAHAFASRDSSFLEAVGRLRAGVNLARANVAVRVIGARSAGEARAVDGVTHAADVVALRGEIGLYQDTEVAITAAVFEAIALLVLLITCTNVSALVVGASVARRHEIAVRLSLGASRTRLVRQLLTESTLLALVAGALGLLMYWWIATLLVARLPQEEIALDLMTVAFTMCFALGTGLLFGLSPALHATRRGAADTLKDSDASATGRSRLQRGFVVAQIALTQPLLVGLGVTITMLFEAAERRPHAHVAEETISVAFNPSDLVSLKGNKTSYILGSASFLAREAHIEATMERVAALPGVVGVARHSWGYSALDLTVALEDRSALPRSSAPVSVRLESASPRYFALQDIAIVRGREFVATDTTSPDIPLIIGRDLARQLWPDADPIGRRFDRIADAQGTRRRYVIVGLYEPGHLSDDSEPTVYEPMRTGPRTGHLIRTVGPAAPLISSVRSIIEAEMPRTSVRLATLAEIDRAARTEALRASGAAGGGGVLALILASIGLYGVVALALGQRRREIGVRIAIGARPREVVWMLFWSGLRLSLAGLVLGLPLSILVTKVAAMELTLPDIDIAIVGGATALAVVAVASIATWLPARHAAAVDPVVTLRTD
jgi:putative ABC transport system permease protein